MPKDKLSHIAGWLILLNSLILLIPNKFKAYPIVLLLLFSIFYKFRSKAVSFAFPYKKFLAVSGLYFIFLLSLLNSFAFKEAASKLSTMASLVAFPLIFGVLQMAGFQVSKKLRHAIFKCFSISVAVFLIGSFIFFLQDKRFGFSETIVHYSNLMNLSLGIFAIHPIYLSLYVGLSIMMLVVLIGESPKILHKIACALAVLFLAVAMGILMRRGPIIGLVIATAILLLPYFKVKKTLLGILAIILVVAASIKFLPKYKNINRFEDMTNSAKVQDKTSSVGIRYIIYSCAIGKMAAKPILGYGIGNVQNQLDPCYAEKGLDDGIVYNSHNQYFSIVLVAGLLGFSLYLLSLFSVFRHMARRRDTVAIAVLVFFMINFLTENVLERENGVLCYAFLISVFLFAQPKDHAKRSL